MYDYDSIRHLFDFTWVPRYGKNNGTIEGSIKPIYECDLWQYTSVGKIAGIKGNIDMNVTMNKDVEWFLNI
jgi:GH25 family lysozyme M1 (1,4-beta-N-acetylmuramidase)